MSFQSQLEKFNAIVNSVGSTVAKTIATIRANKRSGLTPRPAPSKTTKLSGGSKTTKLSGGVMLAIAALVVFLVIKK